MPVADDVDDSEMTRLAKGVGSESGVEAAGMMRLRIDVCAGMLCPPLRVLAVVEHEVLEPYSYVAKVRLHANSKQFFLGTFFASLECSRCSQREHHGSSIRPGKRHQPNRNMTA